MIDSEHGWMALPVGIIRRRTGVRELGPARVDTLARALADPLERIMNRAGDLAAIVDGALHVRLV